MKFLLRSKIGLSLSIFLLFFLFLVPQSIARTQWRIESAFMNGSCFKVVLKSKKACSGTFTVSWWNKGKGYTLNDSYSMIKNGKEVISGCYDDNRAKVAGGAALSATLRDPTKRYCVIQIDGKTVRTMSW